MIVNILIINLSRWKQDQINLKNSRLSHIFKYLYIFCIYFKKIVDIVLFDATFSKNFLAITLKTILSALFSVKYYLASSMF